MAKPIVMVIDDEKRVADNIAKIISETGRYEVIAAYSAKEGLALLAKNKVMLGLGGNKVRLIILDIKMPDMDGLQFLEKVRKEYHEGIGVAMLTAYEDQEKWDKATSGFVIDYIKKPFEPTDLIATVDGFFQGKDAEMTIKTFEKHIEKRDSLDSGKKD
ncbi:MAG: response regulator [bacterium]